MKARRGCEKIRILAVLFLQLLGGMEIFAAPPGRSYEVSQPFPIKEMRQALDDIRHEVSNHEVEIRMFEEQLGSLDAIIDGIRNQISDSTKMQNEQMRGNAVSLETKITALEGTSKGLISDLKQFKTHINEVSSILGQYKHKIDDLEKAIEQQNQNMVYMQEAMQSLMDAIQPKETKAEKGSQKRMAKATVENSDGKKSYCVKAGDTLEKIARAHQTTVEELMELNRLKSDRIEVGKLIKIPEK